MQLLLLFPIQVGAILESSRASSPTSEKLCSDWFTRVVVFFEPLYPFVTKCTFNLKLINLLAIEIANGVLPAPPATTFPIFIIGISIK